MSKQAQIVTAAQRWLGTPYHHAARVHGAGVDCAQLLYAVFVEDLGMVPPFAIDDYPGDWMLHRAEERFLSYLTGHADRVEVAEPGDVAMFKWGRCFAHGAIVTAWPTVIHADIRAGRVVVASADQGLFAGREVQFYRVRGAQ